MTNAAFMARSDFLDSLNAGGDSFQPRTAMCNRSEQCRAPLDFDRTHLLPYKRMRQQNLARFLYQRFAPRDQKRGSFSVILSADQCG